MKLKKLFNNVIFLKILVTILIIFLSYSVVKSNQYERMAFQVSYEKLNHAMGEVREMERLSKVMVNKETNEVESVDFYAIEELFKFSEATEGILELNSYHITWRKIFQMNNKIKIILREDEFKSNKIEYLKVISKYLESIHELYNANISNDIDYYQNTFLGKTKFFKEYKKFMIEVEQLLSEKEFRSLRFY